MIKILTLFVFVTLSAGVFPLTTERDSLHSKEGCDCNVDESGEIHDGDRNASSFRVDETDAEK